MKTDIDVRLDTEVTPEYAEAVGADVLIAAIGSRPILPKIKGIDLPNVHGAFDVYENPALAGDSTVILGGGFVGAGSGIYLASMGKKMKLVEMGPKLNDGGNDRHVRGVKYQLIYKKVETYFHTKAEEICEGWCKIFFAGGESVLRRRYSHLCGRPAASS